MADPMTCQRRVFLGQIGLGLGVAATGAWDVGGAVNQPGPDDPLKSTLSIRKEELKRRVEAIPVELKDWQDLARSSLDQNAHFSQLRAIKILMDIFTDRQRELMTGLDPNGDSGKFLDQASDVIDQILRSQFVWDFFRSKLQLRFDPKYKDSLWIADTIAWDCYRPTLERAAGFDILSRDSLREPPLCYFTAEFSPATWIRGSYPTTLMRPKRGEYRTPIPVIEIPWDHAETQWDFLTLAHEVGHDLEGDLSLRDPLQQSLETGLRDAGVDKDRIAIWKDWQAETFPDLVALQLVGPAYAVTLMHLLLLPSKEVISYDKDDPHPTHYLRILMNTAYIRTLIPDTPETATGRAQIAKHADELESIWKGIYGDPPPLRMYLPDFPIVFRTLMDSKQSALKGRTMRELIPYSAVDDSRIRAAATYLRTGQDRPSRLSPRYCAAAARLAVSGSAGPDMANTLKMIGQRTAELIRTNAAPGLRGSNVSEAHKRFIGGFAK